MAETAATTPPVSETTRAVVRVGDHEFTIDLPAGATVEVVGHAQSAAKVEEAVAVAVEAYKDSANWDETATTWKAAEGANIFANAINLDGPTPADITASAETTASEQLEDKANELINSGPLTSEDLRIFMTEMRAIITEMAALVTRALGVAAAKAAAQEAPAEAPDFDHADIDPAQIDLGSAWDAANTSGTAATPPAAETESIDTPEAEETVEEELVTAAPSGKHQTAYGARTSKPGSSPGLAILAISNETKFVKACETLIKDRNAMLIVWFSMSEVEQGSFDQRVFRSAKGNKIIEDFRAAVERARGVRIEQSRTAAELVGLRGRDLYEEWNRDPQGVASALRSPSITPAARAEIKADLADYQAHVLNQLLERGRVKAPVTNKRKAHIATTALAIAGVTALTVFGVSSIGWGGMIAAGAVVVGSVAIMNHFLGKSGKTPDALKPSRLISKGTKFLAQGVAAATAETAKAAKHATKPAAKI